MIQLAYYIKLSLHFLLFQHIDHNILSKSAIFAFPFLIRLFSAVSLFSLFVNFFLKKKHFDLPLSIDFCGFPGII